jgi:hypothetical protein
MSTDHSPPAFTMWMDFSNIDGSGKKKKSDPVIDSWTNMLNKADKNEAKSSDNEAKITAAEEVIKQGTLTNLRGLMKELDSTAWMYDKTSFS